METRTARQWSVFYAYTAWSVVLIQAIFPLGVLLAFGTPVPALLAEAPAATAVLLVQMVVGAWSGHRALALWSAAALPEARDRWDLPQVGSIPADRSLLATAVPSAVIVLLQLLGLSAAPVLVASLTLLAAAALLRWRWQIGAAAAVATTVIAMAFGLSAPVAFPTGALLLAVVLTVRMSLWLAAMVRELDDAREAQAQLAVAEERLRFARDLHDVTGRDLSVIAVKTELVAQLAERGDPRAAEHGREAAQIARASLAEIRSLVRGPGGPHRLGAARGRDEHPAPRRPVGRGDHPPRGRRRDGQRRRARGRRDPGGRGLTGMRERLEDEATLEVRREDGTFTLDVRFTPTGGSR